MALKWKLFKVLNVIQLIYSTGLFIFLSFITIVTSHRSADLFSIIILFGFLAMAFNSYMNFHLQSNYFPDKTIPRRIERLTLISVIMNIVFGIILLIITIAGAVIEFESDSNDPTGKIAVGILFIILLHWVYTIIMQLKLETFIKVESRKSMTEMLDNLG